MTLYLWIHWFWITVLVSSSLCNTDLLATHLVSTSMTTPSTGAVNQRFQPTSDHSNIPPAPDPPANISSNGTHSNVTEKPYKFIPKKQVDTKLKINATVFIKETTVIEENITSAVTDTYTANSGISLTNHTYLDVDNNTVVPRLQGDVGVAENDTSHENLTAAGITGITVGCVSIVGAICAISFVIYRNRGFNRPQVLNDRCSNPDSSGYIDDASIRDNSEEMYSLDNDSFLNSLEAMTIQNYWTDTVKHTKL